MNGATESSNDTQKSTIESSETDICPVGNSISVETTPVEGLLTVSHKYKVRHNRKMTYPFGLKHSGMWIPVEFINDEEVSRHIVENLCQIKDFPYWVN